MWPHCRTTTSIFGQVASAPRATFHPKRQPVQRMSHRHICPSSHSRLSEIPLCALEPPSSRPEIGRCGVRSPPDGTREPVLAPDVRVQIRAFGRKIHIFQRGGLTNTPAEKNFECDHCRVNRAMQAFPRTRLKSTTANPRNIAPRSLAARGLLTTTGARAVNPENTVYSWTRMHCGQVAPSTGAKTMKFGDFSTTGAAFQHPLET
jgi:hypothetical protein